MSGEPRATTLAAISTSITLSGKCWWSLSWPGATWQEARERARQRLARQESLRQASPQAKKLARTRHSAHVSTAIRIYSALIPARRATARIFGSSDSICASACAGVPYRGSKPLSTVAGSARVSLRALVGFRRTSSGRPRGAVSIDHASNVHARNASFLGGRYVGQLRRSPCRGDCERPDLVCLDLRSCGRHGVYSERDLPADQVVDGWGATLVWHMNQPHVDAAPEQFAGKWAMLPCPNEP